MIQKLALPFAVEAPATARALVVEALDGGPTPAEVVRTAQLLVSELVTNVLRHTTSDSIGLAIGVEPLVISVSDTSNQPIQVRTRRRRIRPGEDCSCWSSWRSVGGSWRTSTARRSGSS